MIWKGTNYSVEANVDLCEIDNYVSGTGISIYDGHSTCIIYHSVFNE